MPVKTDVASIETWRLMWSCTIALVHDQNTRIRQLERDLHAKVQENRKLTADLVRLLRKGAK